MSPIAALFHTEHGHEKLGLRLREIASGILRGLALSLLILPLLGSLLLLRLLARDHALSACLRHALGLRLAGLCEILLRLLLRGLLTLLPLLPLLLSLLLPLLLPLLGLLHF